MLLAALWVNHDSRLRCRPPEIATASVSDPEATRSVLRYTLPFNLYFVVKRDNA